MPLKDIEARRAWNREHKRSPAGRLTVKYACAAHNANARAAALGLPDRITSADVRAVLHGQPCFYCRVMPDEISLDHRVALSVGGANVRSNLVPSCRPCNSKKNVGLHPRQWAARYQACVECGTTERPHKATGLCVLCRGRFDDRKRRRPSQTDEIMELLK